MADAKISQLTELITPSDDDLLAVVDDPGGSATTKKITVANLKSKILSESNFLTNQIFN